MPLNLTVKGKDAFDYSKEEFVYIKDQEVELEHCLLAMSRWESKWKKSFVETFSRKDKKIPTKELFSYIQCMVMNDGVDPNFIFCLTPDQTQKIVEYFADQKTATTIKHEGSTPPRSNEVMTTELIYYYMSQVPLPFDVCERWHFSRLMKTLEIASIKSQPDKKMNPKAWGSKQSAINAMRRAKLHSKG